MHNPYLIDSPAIVSFSGGRTSAYMTAKILEAYNYQLPENIFIIFCNTGKEKEQTLEFVRDCSNHWKQNIYWLEWRDRIGFEIVSFETASRLGEPFAQLISKKKYLPNPVTRFCTAELKIKVIEKFMYAKNFNFWHNVIGLRADETRRVAKTRNKPVDPVVETIMPLVEANITVREIAEYWANSDFDLQLKPYESNCDLCFLKGTKFLETIIRETPSSADWWIAQEEKINARFSKDRPNYRKLKNFVLNQQSFFDQLEIDESLIDCFCTD